MFTQFKKKSSKTCAEILTREIPQHMDIIIDTIKVKDSMIKAQLSTSWFRYTLLAIINSILNFPLHFLAQTTFLSQTVAKCPCTNFGAAPKKKAPKRIKTRKPNLDEVLNVTRAPQGRATWKNAKGVCCALFLTDFKASDVSYHTQNNPQFPTPTRSSLLRHVLLPSYFRSRSMGAIFHLIRGNCCTSN